MVCFASAGKRVRRVRAFCVDESKRPSIETSIDTDWLMSIESS